MDDVRGFHKHNKIPIISSAHSGVRYTINVAKHHFMKTLEKTLKDKIRNRRKLLLDNMVIDLDRRFSKSDRTCSTINFGKF